MTPVDSFHGAVFPAVAGLFNRRRLSGTETAALSGACFVGNSSNHTPNYITRHHQPVYYACLPDDVRFARCTPLTLCP